MYTLQKDIWLIDSKKASHVINKIKYFIPNSIWKRKIKIEDFYEQGIHFTKQGNEKMKLDRGIEPILKNLFYSPTCTQNIIYALY